MGEEQRIWYAAYGSNMYPERFAKYLTGSAADDPYGRHHPASDSRPPRETRTSTMRYPMYFAGQSARWPGSVAFVGLTPSPDAVYPCRLYSLSVEQLMHVACAENGVESMDSVDLDGVEVGDWIRLPVEPGGRATRAKYNALLRLPDVDGARVFTLTTCRTLPRGAPSPEYLSVLRRGLLSLGVASADADRVIDAALELSAP